jgi:hypothetical protein
MRWIARYSAGSADLWFLCRVTEVSDAGAGLILPDDQLAAAGSAITLDLHVDDGDASGIRLQGVVTYAEPGPDGTVRVGVEFVPMGSLEATVLSLLLEREAALASR